MEDFVSSAQRHFEDGETLLMAGRLDNAGHLFGVAGECAIKAVCVEESGSRPTKHFDIVQNKDLRSFAPANLIGRRGQQIAPLLPGLFAGWSIAQRYIKTGTTTEAQARSWKADARAILDKLQGL
jgi:hypothetical protein